MIGLQVVLPDSATAAWLELAAGTLTLEVGSPFFHPDQVPGTLSYPFGVPMTPANLRALDFPHLRVAQGLPVPAVPAQLYLDGVLRWVGTLAFVAVDEDKRLFEYHFLADAADLQARIDGVSLPQLDLGTAPLELVPDAVDYALPCLRNTGFYDAEAVPDYAGVVNYYRQGAYQPLLAGKRSPLVPMPRLVPLLRRVLAAVGYQVSGPWLDSWQARHLVVYSDRAAETETGGRPLTFALNRHVPDVGVGELLVALQSYLGLAYSFHPVRRELRIDTLAAVLADPLTLARTGAGPARTTPVAATGFTLELELEKDDALNKLLDTGWRKFVVGDGKQVVSTKAGTLHVVREADPAYPDREWLVPAVQAKGASPAFGAGDDSRCGLRLLLDLGLQADSLGGLYPLASADVVTYANQVVGEGSLRWAGPRGLYARAHAGWLGFLSRASTREQRMSCTVAELLTLDPARKERVEQQHYLWEKVSLSLPTAAGRPLGTATFTYRFCRP